MQRLRPILFAGAAYALALGACALIGPRAGHSQGNRAAPVEVVNTAATPVPTTVVGNINGTVNVANAPTVRSQQEGDWNVGVTSLPPVDARQSGPWHVDISGNPTVGILPSANTVKLDSTSNTVRIGNTAAAPVFVRDVTTTTGSPFATSGSFFLHHGFDFGAQDPFPPVPLGKRFVIEHISVRAQAPTGQKVLLNLLHGVNGDLFRTFLPATREGGFPTFAPGLDLFTANYSGRTYAEPAQGVRGFRIEMGRSDTNGDAAAGFTVSGHLVDL